MGKDAITFLKELQQELKTQETDMQASPRFWTIMDYKWVVTDEGYHERVTIYFYNNKVYSITLEDYIKDIEIERKDEFTEEEIEELKQAYEYEWFDEVLDWIHKHDTNECRLVFEEEVSYIVENTLFLTKREAKEHLEQNKHHYTEKAHTFAMTAWRSPTVERLLEILETFNWEQVKI